MAYLGRYKDALDAYKEGLKLDPENQSIQSGIADVENLMKGIGFIFFIWLARYSIIQIIRPTRKERAESVCETWSARKTEG